jgi:protocatechuate 3,4-dioxygenase beta subunit
MVAPLALLPFPVGAQVPPGFYKPKYLAPKDAKSKITIAPKTEHGERMMVVGRVTADGKPIQGVSIYVYHTDAGGRYSPHNAANGRDDSENPRLFGFLRTASDGTYEFETIRPAPYPNYIIPAHFHYVVMAPVGFKNQALEIWFEGDKLIGADQRAAAAKYPEVYVIRPVSKDATGIWHCSVDIDLARAT